MIVIGADGLARCPWAADDPMLREYHDAEWGVPVSGEQALFERIMLEAFQAGLSWRTVLAKREGRRPRPSGRAGPALTSLALFGTVLAA